MPLPEKYVMAWIDVETTCIDENEGALLEVAVVIMSQDMSEEYDSRVVQFAMSSAESSFWSDYSKKTHAENLLIDDCRRSPLHPFEFDADLASMIRSWESDRGLKVIPAGRVIKFDMDWFRKHLPKSYAALDYHRLDISSVEMYLGHLGVEVVRPVSIHRAESDIRQDIDFYRKHLVAVSRI